MGDELEKILKEAFSWRDGGEPRTALIRISGISTEIRTEHLPSTSLVPWRYSNLLCAFCISYYKGEMVKKAIHVIGRGAP
jgi:hypothetical protein